MVELSKFPDQQDVIWKEKSGVVAFASLWNH